MQAREPGLTENRAKLVALIEHLDDGIGRVLDRLEHTKLMRQMQRGGSVPWQAPEEIAAKP